MSKIVNKRANGYGYRTRELNGETYSIYVADTLAFHHNGMPSSQILKETGGIAGYLEMTIWLRDSAKRDIGLCGAEFEGAYVQESIETGRHYELTIESKLAIIAALPRPDRMDVVRRICHEYKMMECHDSGMPHQEWYVRQMENVQEHLKDAGLLETEPSVLYIDQVINAEMVQLRSLRREFSNSDDSTFDYDEEDTEVTIRIDKGKLKELLYRASASPGFEQLPMNQKLAMVGEFLVDVVDGARHLQINSFVDDKLYKERNMK